VSVQFANALFHVGLCLSAWSLLGCSNSTLLA
jgi:hypothetical protein